LPSSPPLVTVIIMAHQKKVTEECVKNIIEKTSYSHYEILLVGNCNNEEALVKSWYKKKNIRYLSLANCEIRSPMNKNVIEKARGEILLFFNEHLRVIDPYWLEELVVHTLRSNIGAVGALIYYPEGIIRHAGLILGMDDFINKTNLAGHVGFGLPVGKYVGGNRLNVVQNFSVLGSECLAIQKKIYHQIDKSYMKDKGPFITAIELCLRLREAGYQNIWTPFSQLLYFESFYKKRRLSSGIQEQLLKKEVDNIKQRWSSCLEDDPSYNVNLTLASSNWSLSSPPRNCLI
jgi:hypothetical protein